MRVLLPFIIGAVIFSGTVIFWKTSSTQELSYIERTIKLKSNEITSHVQDNIEERVLSLERMAKRWEKKGRPGRSEWEADANLYISHYAGYRAIGWINDRGFVEWAVPVSGEHDKDFGLKETRQSALIKAKNGLDASISPKVALPDGGSVIMITVPVYAKGRFEGVIAGVFNIQELMDSVLLHEFEGGYAVAVRNNNEEIYRSNDQGGDAWTVDSGFSISDSLWRVTAWPRAETLRGMRSSLPVAILGAGAIISVLLPLAFYFGQTAIDREKATDAVNQKLGDEIAERKRMEGALTESESRLRSIMNNSTAVIYLKDLEGKYILVNHRYEVIFNTTNGFVSGKTDRDLFPKEIAAALRENDVKAIESGTSEEFEETILQSDDAHTYITIKFPLLDSKGIPYAVCGFSTDITKRKKAEELAVRQAKELARSNEELEQYAYVVSHDLKEPLRMVTGYLQLLSKRYKGRLDEDADEFIGYAVDGASRMDGLINDLLAYSRVGKGGSFAPVDLGRIFDKTLPNLKNSIAESGAVVTRDSLPSLHASEPQLEHLFINLISNAIKYRGDKTPVIHVSADKKGNEWLISFRDNGIGIDPKYSERIFTIFERLHGRNEYPGTGIGLAICKKVVENHRGRIWVESEPGQGSIFYFTMPETRV